MEIQTRKKIGGRESVVESKAERSDAKQNSCKR
jgi:hypothetical protein